MLTPSIPVQFLGKAVLVVTTLCLILPGEGVAFSQESATVSISSADLNTAEVLFPTSTDWWVRLEEGGYREVDPDGSMIGIWIEQTAFGDLDGDGTGDAAAILVWNGGGNGFFHSLAVFLPGEEDPEHVATVRLDFVVAVLGLDIDAGEILLRVREPVTTAWFGRLLYDYVRTFRLEGASLTDISVVDPLRGAALHGLSCVLRDAVGQVERTGTLAGYTVDADGLPPHCFDAETPDVLEVQERAGVVSARIAYPCWVHVYESSWDWGGDAMPLVRQLADPDRARETGCRQKGRAR